MGSLRFNECPKPSLVRAKSVVGRDPEIVLTIGSPCVDVLPWFPKEEYGVYRILLTES